MVIKSYNNLIATTKVEYPIYCVYLFQFIKYYIFANWSSNLSFYLGIICLYLFSIEGQVFTGEILRGHHPL